MEGKEAIIAKIIADAEKKAQEIVHAADEYAVSVKEQAEEWAKNYSAEQEKGLKITSYKCSKCGRVVMDDTGYDVSKDYPYCHCGAKMIGEIE